MKRPLLLSCVVLLGACPKKHDKPVEGARKQDAGAVVARDDAAVILPPAPPLPPVPVGLPSPPVHPQVTPDAIALGELLFFEPRLSRSNTMACASCHDPALGFAGDKRQETTAGKPNLRRTPALVNLAWHDGFGWDGRYTSITEHLTAHARGQLGDELAAAAARIGEVPGYRAHFARLGGAPSGEAAATALAAFVLTRYLGAAPWDRLERSPDVPPEIRTGYQLFSGKAQCSVCHTPPLYTDHRYHRLGLIATGDDGRGRVDPAQQGAFKTPTLRGVAVRKGFFHDASATSLDAAIDWHLAGGTGQGADASIIDPALKQITLTAQERRALGAFVRSLTDPLALAAARPPLP